MELPSLSSIVALCCALAPFADAQESKPASRPAKTPRQELTERFAEYRKFRLADDWKSLYAMTTPEHRKLVPLDRYLAFYGTGYLLAKEVELVDVGFANRPGIAATKAKVVVELQVDKLPPNMRPKVSRPEDRRRESTLELHWRKVGDAWFFAMDREVVTGISGGERVRPMTKERDRGKPEQPPEHLPPRAPESPILKSRVLDAGFYNSGQWRGHPAVADLDGDGDLDLVCSVRRWDRQTMGEGLFVYLGNGDGTFEESLEGFERRLGYGGADIADFDRDGALDIAFSGHDMTPHVYLNALESDGQWVCATPGGLPTNAICSDVAAGDFDRDGHLDVVTMGQFPRQGGLRVFFGDGTGGFDRNTEILGKETYGGRVEFADLDRDGHVELVAALDVGLHVFEWDSEEGRAVDLCADHPDLTILGSELGFVIGDFTRDGLLDILVCGYGYDNHAPLRVFERDGDTWRVAELELPAGESFFDVEVGRLEKDGPELLFAAGQWGVLVLEPKAGGGYQPIGRVPGTSKVFNIAVFDATGDGKDELVWIGEGGVRVHELLP